MTPGHPRMDVSPAPRPCVVHFAGLTPSKRGLVELQFVKMAGATGRARAEKLFDIRRAVRETPDFHAEIMGAPR